MDISRFDFELDEVTSLISRLASLATTVEIEPRLHELGERDAMGEIHPDREEPTFRIQCRLRGDDSAMSRVVTVATSMGLETALDGDGTVRFRHLRQNDATGEGSPSSE